MVEYQIPYRNNWTTAAHCLCLIHPIDPRGSKVGGIETHVRLLLQHAPDNWRVLMVGGEGYGGLRIGRIDESEHRGPPRRISSRHPLSGGGGSPSGKKSAKITHRALWRWPVAKPVPHSTRDRPRACEYRAAAVRVRGDPVSSAATGDPDRSWRGVEARHDGFAYQEVLVRTPDDGGDRAAIGGCHRLRESQYRGEDKAKAADPIAVDRIHARSGGHRSLQGTRF